MTGGARRPEMETRRFHYDRGRYGAGLFGGLLAAGVSLKGMAAREAADLVLLDAGLGVGLAAIIGCCWRLRNRRPALVVGPEGLEAPQAMTGCAPWSAIRAVRLRVSHLRTLRLATLEVDLREAGPVQIDLLKIAEPESDVLAAVERFRLVERPRRLGAPPDEAAAR